MRVAPEAGGCLSYLSAQLPSLPSLQYRVLRAGRAFPFALSYQMTHVSRLPGLTMTLPELARAGFLSWTRQVVTTPCSRTAQGHSPGP